MTSRRFSVFHFRRLAELGSTPQNLVDALRTEWALIIGASTTGKAARSTALNDTKLAIAALRVQLFKNLLTCALQWPGQTARARLVFPQHLLENPQSPGEEEPTPPTP